MALSLLSMQYWMRAEHSQSWLFHQMSFHLFCKIWSYRQAMAAMSKLSMNSASSSSLSGGSKKKEVTADSGSSSSIKTEQSALGAELEEELLSRLFWALFTTDRTGSIMENKAPLVVIDNVKPFPRYPNFENDIPTSSPILLAHFHPKILLRSYVRVTTLLSRMSIWMRDATSTSQEEETSEEVLSDLGLNMPQSLRDTRLSLLCEFRNFAETFKPPQRFVMDSEASLDYLPMFDKSLVNNFWISTNWIFLILQCYLESDLKARWCAVKIMTMMTSHSTKIPFSTYIIRIAIGAALSFVRSGKYRKKLNVGAVSSTMISPISPDFQNSSFINSHSSASTPYSVPSSYSTSGTTSNSSSAQNSSNCNDIPDLETVIGWFKEAMKHFQTGMWVIQDDIDAIQDQLNQLQQIWYDDLQSVGTDMNAGVKVGLHTQVNGHGHGYYGGTGG
ncbi:hypothetical protein BKA69DRAFT_1049215 [Paraphysoderma sedebokerense]|nr:hypothetical protein BKA69DRAFT_1049215 [Paraphysoderma sedebokerense]